MPIAYRVALFENFEDSLVSPKVLIKFFVSVLHKEHNGLTSNGHVIHAIFEAIVVSTLSHIQLKIRQHKLLKRIS